MKNIFLFIFFTTTNFCLGQENIVLIDSSTVLCKKELFDEYEKKYETINKSISTSNSKKNEIIKEVYLETQNNFLETINNNNFLCDNEYTNYLNSLLNEVLSKNNIDSKEYKILLSKDSEINAFNLGEGTIVINYGLFLSIDTEDELVFVISHEIGHQYLKHVKNQIESFAEISTSIEIIKKTKQIRKQKYRKATKANDLLKKIIYQKYRQRRKAEIEADSIGLSFYKRTERNSNAAISLLEKLNKVDIEIDSLSIEDYRLIFEENGLILKEKYFNQEESIFNTYDQNSRFETDSLKTHPDCTKRIELIKKSINNSLNKKENIENDFFIKIKKQSTYQNLVNLYSEKEYGISLYETLKLYKKDKNNEFYKDLIYQNTIQIYNAKINYTINRYVPSYDVKSNSKSLNRFITFINSIKISDLETILNNFKK